MLGMYEPGQELDIEGAHFLAADMSPSRAELGVVLLEGKEGDTKRQYALDYPNNTIVVNPDSETPRVLTLSRNVPMPTTFNWGKRIEIVTGEGKRLRSFPIVAATMNMPKEQDIYGMSTNPLAVGWARSPDADDRPLTARRNGQTIVNAEVVNDQNPIEYGVMQALKKAYARSSSKQ